MPCRLPESVLSIPALRYLTNNGCRVHCYEVHLTACIMFIGSLLAWHDIWYRAALLVHAVNAQGSHHHITTNIWCDSLAV